MKLSEQMKKKLTGIAALVIAVVGGVWLFLGSPDHIADTNGPEDTSIQTITDVQIIDRSIGSVGGPTVSTSLLTGGTVHFSADKFTGVYEILYDNYWGKSDFEVNLVDYQIHGGNFKIVVVHDEKIIAELEPGIFASYRLEDITGYISLRIVGESASFSFDMSQFEYDRHTHPDMDQ